MYKNLRMLMAAERVTIDAIAELLGVHRNTVANKLEGYSEFSYSQAMKIRDTFFPGYSADYIFERCPAA